MSDADNRMIEHVGDDMGEGIKNFYEEGLETISTNFAKLGVEKYTEKSKNHNELLNELIERVECLTNTINHIFDGHVLFNGRFVKISLK